MLAPRGEAALCSGWLVPPMLAPRREAALRSNY
jgi:hypothetical protein